MDTHRRAREGPASGRLAVGQQLLPLSMLLRCPAALRGVGYAHAHNARAGIYVILFDIIIVEW